MRRTWWLVAIASSSTPAAASFVRTARAARYSGARQCATPAVLMSQNMMDILAEEAELRASMAADALEAAAPAEERDLQDLTAVDVDLSLSLSEADASEIQAEADAIFDRVDSDGDGRVSMAEVTEHLSGSSVAFEPNSLLHIFETLDANGDGFLSREELRAGFRRHESCTLRLALGLSAGAFSEVAPSSSSVEKLLTSDRRRLCDELFDTIDTNGDGVIQLEELRTHLFAKRGYSVSTIDGIFTALDVAPKNDEISRDELRRSFALYDLSVVRRALGLR